jgi:transcriptional regulator GlxA family with amidase domain
MYIRVVSLVTNNILLTSLSALRDVVQAANEVIARQQHATGEGIPQLQNVLVSADGEPVSTWCGMKVAVDYSIRDVPPADVVYVPAIYTSINARGALDCSAEQPDYIEQATSILDVYLRAHAELLGQVLPWLRSQRQRGAALAGVATGNLLFAEAGLLQKMRLPVPWMMEAFVRTRYPGITPEKHRDIVVADNIFCAGNLGSSVALAIELLRTFTPLAVADLIARQVRPLEVALETPAVTAGASGCDPVVIRAMALIQQRFNRGIDYEAMAANLAVSQRTLIRHFNHDLGMTPHAYQQQLRLEAAQRLLATTQLPIAQVATQVGYTDAGYFSRLFRNRVGVSAQAYQISCRQSRCFATQQRATLPNLIPSAIKGAKLSCVAIPVAEEASVS